MIWMSTERRSGSPRVAGIQRSLEQLLERSRAIGRKMVFAHQAACLEVKAKTTYRLPSMESVFPPNAKAEISLHKELMCEATT